MLNACYSKSDSRKMRTRKQFINNDKYFVILFV